MNAYQVSIPQTIGAALHSIVILAALLWYLLTGGKEKKKKDTAGNPMRKRKELHRFD